MRKLTLGLSMAFVLLASAAVGAEVYKYKVGITGMTWGAGCSNAVRATLSRLDNVDKVAVDFSGKTATVTLKKGKLTKTAVAAAFEGSRYGVSSFKEIALVSKSYTVNVSGMTWGSCPTRVRETLSAITGVADVKIDNKKKTATVTMKPGVDLQKDTVVAALKKSERYGVTGFEEIRKPAVATLVLGIEGMTWGGCAGNVRGTLSKLKGVDTVSVDMKNKKATVKLKEGANVTKDAVVKAFEGSRYKVTTFDKM